MTSPGGARPGRWPGCWSRTSPGSWPGPTRRCCWPTSAPTWSRSRAPRRRRHPHLAAAGARRRLDVLPRRQPQQALGRPRPARRRTTCALARELARRADVLIENFRPGGLARFGLDYDSVAAGQPGRRLRLDQRLRQRPGAGRVLPGYDLIVQAISGLMSLTGDPDGEPYRAGVAVFDVIAGLHATIGILAALQPRGTRPAAGSTSRSACSPRRCPGMVNQTSALRRRGRRPVPDGQQPPQPVPLRAAALRRRRADHHRGQRRRSSASCARCSASPSWPTTRASPATRTAPPTATSCGPLLVERLSTRTDDASGSATSSRAGRAVRADQHRRPGRRRSPRRSGSTRSSRWARATAAVPSVRNPITFSETPAGYRLPPPALDEHGDEIRALAGSRAVVRSARAESDGLSFPTSLGHVDAPTRSGLLGQDLAARPDGQGRLRRAGLLAGRRCAGRRRRRPGCSRRCWSRWPTTASPRRRSPPGSPTCPRPDSLQGALAAGLLGGGSRFLGVTEDCGQLPARRARPPSSGDLPTDDAGWDALALDAVVARDEAAEPLRARASGTRCTRCCDPRTPRLIAIADGGGAARAAPAAVRGDRPGTPSRCSVAGSPLNGAGVCGAALADLGLPLELLRGFALLARAAGLLGQLAEELPPPDRHGRLPDRRPQRRSTSTRPTTPAPERRAAWPPSPRSSPRPTTPSTTARAPRPAPTGRRSPTSGWPRSRPSARR